MRETTIGQLLVNRALPPDLRDYHRKLDKKGVKQLLQQVAEKHPDRYREVAKAISDVGWDAAFTTGGYSFGLKALRTSKAARTMQKNIQAELDAIYEKNLPPEQQEQQILEVTARYQKKLIQEVMDESIKENNPLALQAVSGARGNAFNVNALRGADLLYVDHRGRAIPLPVTRSYSAGLSPAEYFAGSFGARKGIVDLKLATQNAGYLAKQLVQLSHRQLVSQEDDENPYDESIPRGLPVETADPDNAGGLLAHPVGGYARNTILTPKILKDLTNRGHNEILIRSPTVGGPRDGGVYGRDVGIREKGRLAPVGDWVGVASAQALAEPITQAQISSKHCLAGDTLVRMADLSVKEIRDICVGDWVLGADMTGQTFPVQVVNVFDNGERECYRTVFRPVATRSSCELVSTLCHKILTHRGKFAEYSLLPVGEGGPAVLAMTDDQDGPGEALLQSQQAAGGLPTYDIEVDHPDHLFVLANALIVSNSGGVAGASSGAISGFKHINNLIQGPKVFPGGATLAQDDGTVTGLRDAPQGGQYVLVNGKEHYVSPETPVTVKVGDKVEAGDVLSEGVPNPYEVVKHKGIGEGRRYFTNIFRQAISDSGGSGNRRNVELLARGLINHVRLTDELGDWSPDDVVPYQFLESQWRPRPGHLIVPPAQAAGHYLERPVLHYSVGTKIRPSMLKQFQKYGVKSIYAHKDPPPFEPEMVRGMANVAHDPDWMVRMLGSYQKNSLLEGARRGDVSDEESSSFVPALARGENFGKTRLTQGWSPAK